MRNVIRFRPFALPVLLTFVLLFLGVSQVAFARFMGPVDASGHLGYYYRALNEDGGPDNSSHQLGGTVNMSTFFGEPWLSTAYLSLSLTQDSSETVQANAESSTDSQLLTGDFGLNVLPSSRTPFSLLLQATDTRVDSKGSGFIPITFVGQEYSTLYLGLRQSFLTQKGTQYRLNYDYRTWESGNDGEYDDNLLGFEADLRRPKQRLFGRGSVQTNEHSLSQRNNESLLLDMTHYYFPVRNFRLDSKASYYEYDRSFVDPSATDTRLSTLNIAQVSSNAFWRPSNHPLSLTAGARVYNTEGNEGSVPGTEITNVALNSGLFYQMSRNLRLDASLNSLFGDNNGVQDDIHQQAAGFVYQTDLKEALKLVYQAYVDGDLRHRVDVADDIMDWSLIGGHGLSRTWWPGERTSTMSFRLHLSQALAWYGAAGDVLSSRSGLRFDNSFTLSFNQRDKGGDTLAQITMSDSRDVASEDISNVATDRDTEQQLINLQLNRNQELGRRSSITGNITVQYVRLQEENTSTGLVNVDESDTTTATGRILFQHFQMLGIPRLHFSSDFIVSNISTPGAIDRTDWENRLTYLIGKLETTLSYRLTETDSRNYDLLYFRLMRRF